MNSRRCSLVLASLGSLLLVPLCQAQEISLFNGRDLAGWEVPSDSWSVEDGAITGKKLPNSTTNDSCLVWKGTVSDFELNCKYKLTPLRAEDRAASGIVFRATLGTTNRLVGYFAQMDIGTLRLEGLEVDTSLNGALMFVEPPPEKRPTKLLALAGQKVIVKPGYLNSRQANTLPTGTLGSNADFKSLFKIGQWNDYRIICVGNHFQIFVNGRQTVDVVDEAERPKLGLLGFNLFDRKDAATIQFKDLKLRLINGGGPPQLPITPTAALTLDPNQPLLDTFSQLAPNASEWVLAGLDEGVPPNVRQNLTYLREDLLDEYKQKPKASQDAYKLAHQLCSTMITALNERDQTLVRAGFRAVQADAGISGTNQALQARRNYMMSWPQYAREQAQRSELIRQGTAGAQVSKALPKVEWSTRTAALRKTLDGLYAQFREALRQSLTTK
jgi:hypothetical protein